MLVAVLALNACGGKSPKIGLYVPAPNPNGCYAFVYQRPNWQGNRAVLNGPSRWGNLERLQLDQIDWRNRIRSLDVGAAATVNVYTEPNFGGTSRRYGPGSQSARLDDELRGGIESLDMSCPAGK